MPTTNHGLNKPAKGDKAWHTDVNANWDDIDERLPRDYAGDPNSNVAGAYVGQLIYDSTNDTLYACTTTGDAATTVWEKVSPDLSGYLQASDNLASLADAPTALNNLGLTATAAELNQLDDVTLGALASLDTVGTSEIDNDAVTLAKMSTGTADSLLGYDASGNPSEVSAGSNITLSDGVISSPDPVIIEELVNITVSGSGGVSSPSYSGTTFNASGCFKVDLIAENIAFSHNNPAFFRFEWGYGGYQHKLAAPSAGLPLRNFKGEAAVTIFLIDYMIIPRGIALLADSSGVLTIDEIDLTALSRLSAVDQVRVGAQYGDITGGTLKVIGYKNT